jgi:hypothetical protein
MNCTKVTKLLILKSYLLLIAKMPHKIRRTLFTLVREVIGSNLGKDIRYPADIRRGLSQSL